MPAITLQRVFGDGPDMKTVLNNCSIARLIGPDILGESWNHLRLGTRIEVNANPASWIIDFPVFVMGLCSGVVNPWNNGLKPTTHFIGGKTTNEFWTNAPANYHYLGGTGTDLFKTCKRIGLVETLGNNFGGAFGVNGIPFPNVALATRMALFMDFVKTGIPGELELRMWKPNAFFYPDMPYSDFIDNMTLATPTWLRPPDTNYYGFVTETITVDEATHGVLNAVNFGSNKVDHIEISDAVIARFG